ncbi:MAG: TonB-dependent receptor [Alphaproteobacteria bacterium]|nr:TonB-dependent receptor [Alphaproteobacteria bacterium]MBN9557541.1 TonB-dependent receptor [Alphaproteobacteria bacterium]MBN9577923.1 TonB-dependent receptor [Alphaproteobacteria bacterium]
MPGTSRAVSRVALTLCALTAASQAGAQDQKDRFQVETVIVTAARNTDDAPVVAAARNRLSRTPGAVAVVAAESYENRLVVGMPDLLRDVPGVIAEKRYGEESRLSIRGSGISQPYHQRGVLLAQDGVPFADADGFSDFQKVDALGARYIEVYKGGNALRFGGAQLGGAINLITPTGRTAEAPDMLRLEGGSFGTVRGRAAVARADDDWDVYGAIEGMTADGFRDWSGQKEVRGTLNTGYSFGTDQEIRLIAYGADIRQQVPGTLSLADALATPQAAGANVVANRWARNQTVGRLSLQTHWRFDDNLSFDGGVYVTHTDIHHPISIVIAQNISTEGLFGRFDWAGTVLGRDADLFWGVSYRQGVTNQNLFVNAGGANGAQFGNGRQQASGLDVFGEGRLFVVKQLALVLGGSYGLATRDYRDRLNPANNAAKDFDWLSPRIGLLWQDDNGTQIYTNLTRSVEPPHYGALVQAPYPGFVPVVPQKAWTFEFGTRGRTSTLVWDVDFYRASLKDEMLSYAVFGLPSAFFNADRTIHQGVEAGLDWTITDDGPLHGRLTLRQTYTWSDFHFDGDATYGDNRLPVIPVHQYRAELKYELPDGLFVAPSITWRPVNTYADYANTMKVPGYALYGLSAGVRINSHLSLFLDARNLADKHYVPEFGAITNAADPTVNTAVFYPGEGRAFYVGARAGF